MKKYIIKYEDHSGECYCETVIAISPQHAKTMLQNDCAFIYWIKKFKTISNDTTG